MSVERLFKDVPGIPEKWNLERIGYPEQGDYYLDDSGPKLASAYTQLERPVAIIQNVADYYYPKGHHGSTFIGRKARFRTAPRGHWTHGTVADYRRTMDYKWKCLEDGKWYRYAQIKQNPECS